MLSLLAILACTVHESPVSPDGASLFLLAGTGDTGDDTAALEESLEEVYVVFGQSNAGCNLVKPNLGFPHSLAVGGDHYGTRLIRNGADLADYGLTPSGAKYIGPEAFIVDELVDQGHDPENITVVVRCISGSLLLTARDTLFPLLLADLATFGLPTPIGLVFWQGEGDARNVQLARLYRDRLMVPIDGEPSLFDVVDEAWPGVLWSLVELRVRDPDYASVVGQQLVRAAQHELGAFEGVCTIPSYDAELLPGDNQPHTSLVGTETVGRRAVHGWLDADCP